MLRSICKHNDKIAETVVKNGGLQTLAYCLDDFDCNVSLSTPLNFWTKITKLPGERVISLVRWLHCQT